jgi:hypothetical protein
MASIIAGTFANSTEAKSFVETLIQVGISNEDISVIPVGPGLACRKNRVDSRPANSHFRGEERTLPAERVAGSLAAVHAEENREILSVVLLFNRSGAKLVEWATGSWNNGRWDDFEPLEPPRLVGKVDEALITLLG